MKFVHSKEEYYALHDEYLANICKIKSFKAARTDGKVMIHLNNERKEQK